MIVVSIPYYATFTLFIMKKRSFKFFSPSFIFFFHNFCTPEKMYVTLRNEKYEVSSFSVILYNLHA